MAQTTITWYFFQPWVKCLFFICWRYHSTVCCCVFPAARVTNQKLSRMVLATMLKKRYLLDMIFFYISAFFSNLLCRFHTNASHMHRKNGCGRISSAGGEQSLQHTFMRSNFFKHYQCINDISKLTWVKVLVYPEIHRFSGILPRIFLCVWVRYYAKCSYSTIGVFDGTKYR